MNTIKQKIDVELDAARRHLASCVDTLAAAQERVVALQRLANGWTDEREKLVAELMAADVIGEPMQF